MVERLAIADPIVDGTFEPSRLGLAGETLTCEGPSAGQVEVPADDVDRMVALIAERVEELGEVPRPVVAASWTNHLVTLLVPGLLAAWTLHDVAIDASAGNLALHADEGGPSRWRIVDPGRVDQGRDRRDRTLESVVEDTLRPLFAEVEATTGLRSEIGWTHVGNVAAYLFDRLEEAGNVTQGCEDRAGLLHAEDPAWSRGPNPLRGTVRYEPLPGEATPERYQIRTRCCLKREIPGKIACASCPHIETPRRAELVDARRRQA